MAINYAFKFGKVISTSDKEDGGRIRVHISGEDPSNFNMEDIPYAFPLLPKHLQVKPKIGEQVFVFTQDGNFIKDRFYLGPIISQSHKLDIDTITSDSLLRGGSFKPDKPTSMIPENRGLQPDDDDVCLLGRGSTDILQKKNEIRIRAGKTLDFRTFNTDNTSYIQLKHNTDTNKGQINVVSDKINLLSHESINKFNLLNPDELITDEEFDKILKEAHVLPFGDILVKYMLLLKKAFLTHVHAYNGLPPDQDQVEIKNYNTFDTETILSKNIRIN